jgi:hypothetical protein
MSFSRAIRVERFGVFSCKIPDDYIVQFYQHIIVLFMCTGQTQASRSPSRVIGRTVGHAEIFMIILRHAINQ